MKSGSKLEKVLAAGHFAFTGELGPPRGSNVEEVRKKAAFLKERVDAVNITDNQTAMVRMASWAAGLLAIEEGRSPAIDGVEGRRSLAAVHAVYSAAGVDVKA